MASTLRLAAKALLSMLVFYAFLCLIFIYKVAYTDHSCGISHPNTPADWVINLGPKSSLYKAGFTQFDTKKWLTHDFKEVTFPSRHPGVTIHAWHTESDPKAPTIIVSHGIKPNCKAHTEPLMVTALLHQAGFNVLNIDLQNYGESTHTDSFIRLGQREYLDVLGAFDWLVQEKKVPSDRVGLVGLSLGAVTSAIAFSKEPEIKAAWLDSPFVDFDSMFTFELQRYHLPTFFKYGVYVMADIVIGTRPNVYTCRDALTHADGRAIFLTQGTDDGRIPFEQGLTFVELADHADVVFDHWFVHDTDHLDAMFRYPYTYQKKLKNFFNTYLAP